MNMLTVLLQYGSLYEEVVRRTERDQPMRAVEILSIFLQVTLQGIGPFPPSD